MTYYNSGVILCRNTISEDLKKRIRIHFGTDESAYFYINGNAIEINDLAGRLGNAIRQTVKDAAEYGNPVTDVTVSYYGDDDGGYGYENGKVVDLDEEDVILMNCDDDKLLKECRRRGLM